MLNPVCTVALKKIDIDKNKYFYQQHPKGLSKVSSSITLGGNKAIQGPLQGTKMAQHSHSMSNLRKASISGPTNASMPMNAPIGSNSNFYLSKNEYG